MWQPIETAPRDQTFLAVLNCAGEQTICTMRWPVAEAKNSRPDNKTFHVERVTHWMPLPELPGAQPTPSVPDGWKLVPIEPTQEMINHVIDERLEALVAGKEHTFIDIYKAMLAAAPKPEGE